MPEPVHRMARRRWLTLLAVAAVLGLVAVAALRTETGYAAASYLWTKLRGGYTVGERVEQFSPQVRSRLEPAFTRAGVAYPPREVAYVAIKDQRKLQVYARDSDRAAWKFIREYRVLAQSGGPGPKLRSGDRQVPEGIYAAEYLNANSRFHVSIRLDYPNAVDRAAAVTDGRTDLGSDIMIHGSAVSVGCLAVGNDAAEDLFVLAALVSREHVRIVVSPVDFRDPGAVAPSFDRPWIADVYRSLRTELSHFPAAP